MNTVVDFLVTFVLRRTLCVGNGLSSRTKMLIIRKQLIEVIISNQLKVF